MRRSKPKNIPFLNYNQRYAVVKNIKEIDVVPQTTLDYTNNLRKLNQKSCSWRRLKKGFEEYCQKVIQN